MSTVSRHASYRTGVRGGEDRRVSDGWLAVVSAIVGVLVLVVSLVPETASNAPNRAGVQASGVFILVGLLMARLLGGAIHSLSSLAVVAYCQFLLFMARPMYQLLEADSMNAFTGSTYGVSFLTYYVY